MLNKILQNRIIAGTVAVLLLIIAVIVFVLMRDDSQEQTRSDLDIQIENATEEESLKTPFEIVEDDSKTQTESVDAPISWDENYENSINDKTDTTGQTDSSLPSTDKDKETNIPIENAPDDGDVEYGSIF